MTRSFEELIEEIENGNPEPVGKTYQGEGLKKLAAAIKAEQCAQAAITEAVALARSEGATWEMIGDYLGITRAGAYKKFKKTA